MKPTRLEGEPFYAYLERVNEYFAANPPNPEPSAIKNQRPDQDPKIDQDLRNLKDHDRSRSQDQRFEKNPDGLDDQIHGQYAETLKNDPLYLQARSWGCHPMTLTAATKRMGVEWVKRQIKFVSTRSLNDEAKRGNYLGGILKRNKF